MDLARIQSALRENKFDAWLFYDHHHRDPIAYRILGLAEDLHVTRRWYYLIPAQGDPQKLVHRIEAGRLDTLPGSKAAYSSWEEQTQRLREIVSPYKTLAMQYSPNNAIPYIGLVDAGTIELIRSFGVNIVSSGNLVSLFEAALTADQIASHFEARDAIDRIMQEAFREIGARCKNGAATDEFEIQKWILNAFERENLISDSAPIVAVNANASNPHYAPSADEHKPIKRGDFVLLDMWGKKNRPDSVFYDITWTGVVGAAPTDKQIEVFHVVNTARDKGLKTINSALSQRNIAGWEVDKAVRDHITDAGYGKYFIHRTGHSIATEVHGNGANMDNLETKDERLIIDNTLFSLEPGIYLPEFGVRCEYDVLVRSGKAEATGRVQTELLVI